MIPDEMPIWTTDDILINGEYEDESTGQKSTVGWLKSLYLWREEGDYIFMSTAQDYKDYNKAVTDFKRVNKIPQSVDIDDWEEDTNASQQRIALNRFRKDQGYVVEQ